MSSNSSSRGSIRESVTILPDHRIEALLTELPRREIHRHRGYIGPDALPAANLRADTRNDPFADRDDEPGIFQHRDELAGLHEPAIRTLPTQQRLETADEAGGEVDLRLVVNSVFVPIERSPQLRLEPQALRRPGLHLRQVELVGVTTRLLGAIHRRVGIFQQHIRLGAITRIHADPDTGGDIHRMAVDHERLRQCRSQSFARRLRRDPPAPGVRPQQRTRHR